MKDMYWMWSEARVNHALIVGVVFVIGLPIMVGLLMLKDKIKERFGKK